MGYLDNTIVTVDAVLTKKGRECLAKGDGSFNITQFALADDEIDYTLYNPNHPSGSLYYGEAIENMALLEAFVDENQAMKYKLATLPRGTSKLPVISLGRKNITLRVGAGVETITPQTLNYLGLTYAYEANGYIATVADIRLFSSFNATSTSGMSEAAMSQSTIGTNTSATVVGSSINLTPTASTALFDSLGVNKITTSLTIVGVDSGARMTIPVEITKN